MAHIFKHPEGLNKGIVVLTHKELAFLVDRNRLSKRDFLSPITAIKKQFSNIYKKGEIGEIIEKIREKYFIGVHWGGYTGAVETPTWVDFNMSARGNGSFSGDSLYIPLCSANFTPDVMFDARQEKYWDLICVAKSHKVKKIPVLMDQIKRIYKRGYSYRVLIVIASNRDETGDKFDVDLFDKYYADFTAEERELFTIIKTDPDMGFQGFSYSFLSHLYNQSKVFTIFSQKEGECRVIKEAQLCGLPVVVKSDMQGGGRDYLNNKNALFFDSYDTAFETLIDAVEGFDEFEINCSEIKKEIGEQESIEQLKSWFKELFQLHGQSFDGYLLNTDNLNRRLPSHYFDPSVGWAASPDFRFKTTDIVNYKMLCSFSDHLYL